MKDLIKNNEYLLILIVLVSIAVSKIYGLNKSKMIYILTGTNRDAQPLRDMALESYAFTQRNCSFQNCYATDNISILGDVKKFPVVLFNAINLHAYPVDLPTDRSPYQKYVFCSTESAGYFPVPSKFNGIFNWTWTYKLNSDLCNPYVIVRNRHGKVIGPRIDMEWIDIKDMKPTSKYVKNKLRNKKIAAAWFVSNCNPGNNRSGYVRELNEELGKYGHRVDVYGDCGKMKCSKDDEICYALIETDYYFYLAFENAIVPDYVTEKLLTALEHFAVPIVYGGADYKRFMPDGIYLNAHITKPRKLARIMVNIINDKEKYYDFFKWHSHYSFHHAEESADTNMFCRLCEFLNKKLKLNETSEYKDIVRWFNNPEDWPENEVEPKVVISTETPSFPSKIIDTFTDLYNHISLFVDE